ncbi:unannotated protein [freshwater metagenome]|uniref:Unannotated protein n=1 Tax=freshwater metagenome TaxID=449393 RepID=A0A6J6W0E7_9ZZZZ
MMEPNGAPLAIKMVVFNTTTQAAYPKLNTCTKLTKTTEQMARASSAKMVFRVVH